MLRLKDNTFVKNAHLLECAYEVKDGEIRANVSSPYILDLSLRQNRHRNYPHLQRIQLAYQLL